MSINGANNNKFKVSTVGHNMPHDDWAAQTTDPTAGIDDLFDTGPDGTGQAGGSDPFDAWMCYETTGGVYNNYGGNSVDAWISDFPPSLENVLAQNENAINYLDMVRNRYEKAKEDLHALKETYKQAIQSGTMTSDELQEINNRMPALDAALSRCKSEMDKCSEMATEQARNYIEEYKCMTDLDGNKWIGRPFVEGSYYVQYNDDGTTTYIDPISKKAVPCPIMDPEYSAEIVANNSLIAIDESDSKVDKGTLGIADVYLKLNESALSNSNTFGCPIDIGIPEYLWVEREDGTYKTDFFGESSEEKMVLYNSWKNDSGLSQNVPEDLSKYMQVKITRAVVHSIQCGTTSDGDALYSHVVELYDKDDVFISRISIEGTEAVGHDSVNTGLVSEGYSPGGYIAASSVGLAIHDANRASPLELDCTRVESTGRHVTQNLESIIGSKKPGNEQGNMTYNENIDLFAKKNYSSYHWDSDEGEWDTKNHELNEDGASYSYGSCNDRYLPPDKNVKVGDGPVTTLLSGVHVSGLRGKIIGSRHNDVIVCPGVNEYSDYALDHLPDDLKETAKGDPFYSNFVDCQGGNDVVKVGRGDNYVLQATFLWHENGGPQDDLFVQFPDQTSGLSTDANADISPNQKTFLHFDGGHAAVYNPHEFIASDYTDSESKEEVEAMLPCTEDDWYEKVHGSIEFGNPSDPDVINSIGTTNNTDVFNKDHITQAMEDPEAAWYEALTSVPGEGDIDTDIDWDEVMGSKTELDAEMDSFFGEMFGDLNSFIGEYQEEQMTGF